MRNEIDKELLTCLERVILDSVSEIIADRVLIRNKDRKFIGGINKAVIENIGSIKYEKSERGYNRCDKVEWLGQEITRWSGDKKLVVPFSRIESFLKAAFLCLCFIVENGIPHKIDKSYYMVKREYYNGKNFERVLNSRLYFGDGKYLTGFSMMEGIGFGEVLKEIQIGKVCYGFKLSERIIPLVCWTGMKKFVKLDAVEYGKIKGCPKLIVKENIYPRMELYREVVKKIQPEFENNRLIKFMAGVCKSGSMVEFIAGYDKIGENGEREDWNESLKYMIGRMCKDLPSLYNVENKYRLKRNPEGIRYTPVFSINATGRITEIHGIQGLSRFTKRVLFDNLWNYDFANSQMVILSSLIRDMIEEIGEGIEKEDRDKLLDKKFDDFIKNKNSRRELADRIGITLDEMKKAQFSYLYGANFNSDYGIFVKSLRSKYGDKIAREKIEKLNVIIDEYFSPFHIWGKYVKLYMNKKYLIRFGNIKNEMDKKLDNDELGYYNGLVFIPMSFERAGYSGFLTSFLLQGIESRIIFDIILNGKNPVISYEYDGILSNFQLDDSKVQEIISSYGIENLRLVQKPFQNLHYNILTGRV